MLRSIPVSLRNHSKESQSMQSHDSQHKCYFHNTNNITKFCINKKCTLPLCQKCIPIHIKQHAKQQKTIGKQNIILYSDAHRIALNQLSSTLNKKQQKLQKFQSTVKNARTQIEQIIESYFAQIEKRSSDCVNEIKILTEKQIKIKKGSLKTLIFYFADQQGFKIKSQSNRNCMFNFSDEIVKLTKKLNHQLKTFQEPNEIYQPVSVSVSYRQNRKSVPQIKDFQKNQQSSKKYQTSTDFAQVLKDQRNRLQNVRNKNLMFATGYDSIKQDDNFKKYGSKSVDNFYSNRTSTDNELKKEQKENRPLQFGFKSAYQGFSMKKQNFEDSLNSQQKIDKIRKKYVGDQSLSKQKRHLTQNLRKQQIVNLKTNDEKPQKQKQFTMSDRILSRQQIRLDIENRLQQKVVKNVFETQKLSIPTVFSLKQQSHETFRKPQKSQQAKDLPIKKQQEFTLNKNYGLNDTQKLQLQKEKILMSSIKKELKAVPTDECIPKQARFKSFFEGNDRQRLNSFDVRQEKNTKFKDIQNKHQITDFVINRSEEIKQGNFKQQQFSKKKDQLYEETKQRIRLSQPTLIKGTQDISKKNHQQKENVQIPSKVQVTQKATKEGRRFNYLYDSSNTTQGLNRIL